MTAPNGKTVTIRRDGWGVPYIDAEDRESAEYGLGFAAAQDRLWLFDVLRRAGRGRASEFLGPSDTTRSEEHTSELQSLMRISYAVFCLKKKKYYTITHYNTHNTYQYVPMVNTK